MKKPTKKKQNGKPKAQRPASKTSRGVKSTFSLISKIFSLRSSKKRASRVARREAPEDAWSDEEIKIPSHAYLATPEPKTAPAPPLAPLPTRYGDDRVVLLVRDPWWLFAYWEFTPRREGQVLDEMARAGAHRDKLVLRVYDVTGLEVPNHHSHFDIELGPGADNWYIDVGKPDREWLAEVGYRTADGRFFMLVRSNVVRTPRFGVSDVLDEEWMMPDDLYWKLFGLSGGYRPLNSSLELREFLEKYLRSLAASENSPSFSLQSRAGKS